MCNMLTLSIETVSITRAFGSRQNLDGSGKKIMENL